MKRFWTLLNHSVASFWPAVLIILIHAFVSAVFGHQRWLDPVLHFLGGMTLLYAFSYWWRVQHIVPYKAGWALFSALAVMLLWELGEFLSDKYLHTHVQQGAVDTYGDLVLGFSGAVIALLVLEMRRKRAHKVLA